MKKVSVKEFRANLALYMKELRDGKPVQVKNLILMAKPVADLTSDEYNAILGSEI